LSNNDNINVLHEKKISYVSDENIKWLDPHIAAATADVVLAVEKNARRMAIVRQFMHILTSLGTPLGQSR